VRVAPVTPEEASVPEEQKYPFTVHLRDQRVIICDVHTDGDYVVLAKRVGSVRVHKNEIVKIVRNLPAPATRPATQPVTQPTTSTTAPPDRRSR
jgi:hypothetical protein